MRKRRFGGTRFRGRRQRGPETYTVVQCRQATGVWQDAPCSDPVFDAFLLMGPAPSVGFDASTAAATVGQKANVVQGIKFQVEHFIDPSTAIDGDVGGQPSFNAFILTCWEAIVVLPLLVGSKTLPAYFPDLSSNTQSADLADRVLWKRISHMPFWGFQRIPDQLQTTVRDTGAGPQVVKANARLDDKHGLFYIRNFVHDLVIGGSDGTLPVMMDGWFKIFYRTRF